jgi:hypothetical protein
MQYKKIVAFGDSFTRIGPNGHPLEKAHAEAAKYINIDVIEGMTNGHR